MLHHFGQVYSPPDQKIKNQVIFVAKGNAKSLIVLTMAADDIKVFTQSSKGRIVSAFIDTFEALSTTGLLEVEVQNTGDKRVLYKASYCSTTIQSCLLVAILGNKNSLLLIRYMWNIARVELILFLQNKSI